MGYLVDTMNSRLSDKSDVGHTHPAPPALANNRTFNVSGDVTGSAQSFNGSGNVTIPTTITDNSVSANKLVNGVSPIKFHEINGNIDLNTVATTHAYITTNNWLGNTPQYTNTPSGLATGEGFPWLLQNLVRDSARVVQKIYVGHQHDTNNGVPREFIRSNNNNNWGPWHEMLTVPSGTGSTWSRVPNDSIPISKISDKYSNTNPRANGTVAQGTSTRLSREDHVHPLQTTITGNAGTATTLQNSRNFNVSGDATGTAQSFNGSGNVTIPITIAYDVVNYDKLARGTTPSKQFVDFPTGGALPTGSRANIGFYGYIKENVTGFPPESATGDQGMIILPRGSGYSNTFRLAYDQTNRMFSSNQGAAWKEFMSVNAGTGTVWDRIPSNAIPWSAINATTVTANTLVNSRTFNVSGDVTGTAQSFNGGQNVTIPTTLSLGASPIRRRTDIGDTMVVSGANSLGFYGFSFNNITTGAPATVTSGDGGMILLPRGNTSTANTFRIAFDSSARLYISNQSNANWVRVVTVPAEETGKAGTDRNVQLRSLTNTQIFDSTLTTPADNNTPTLNTSTV